jgi:hypothetical protein
MLPRCKSKYCQLDNEYHLVNLSGDFIVPRVLLQSYLDKYEDKITNVESNDNKVVITYVIKSTENESTEITSTFVAIESTTHSEKNYS